MTPCGLVRGYLANVFVLVVLRVNCCFTLDSGLLAISQNSEGPVTGHLDKGFCWFPSVYKQMLRWFPKFQVVTTCFSCSPPDKFIMLVIKQLNAQILVL